MTASPDVTAAVSAVIDRYIAAFNRQDWDTALTCYALPVPFVSSGGIVVMSDPHTFVSTMTATHASLRRKGLDRSVFTEKHIALLGEGVALASCRCLRLRSDGSVLSDVGGTYGLQRGEAGWRITNVLAHDRDTAPLEVGTAVRQPAS